MFVVVVDSFKSFDMEDLIETRLYFCFHCRNHVALHDDVISKAFQVNILTFHLLRFETTLPSII